MALVAPEQRLPRRGRGRDDPRRRNDPAGGIPDLPHRVLAGLVRGAWRPVHVGHAIVFHGVEVRPGDLLLGDIDGVVVVPRPMVEES